MIIPGGGLLLPSSRFSGFVPGGMVMDEIDTCIIRSSTKESSIRFGNLPYLQSIEEGCNRVLHLSKMFSHSDCFLAVTPCPRSLSFNLSIVNG